MAREIQPSMVRDLKLKPIGKDLMTWVEDWMPVLNLMREEFRREKPFRGLAVGICLHLEAKTAVLAKAFAEGGAKVAITSSNPETTQDAVAAALTDYAHVYAWRGETPEEYVENLRRVLDHEPNIIIDDGADLTVMAHEEKPEILDGLIGVCEETMTGVLRFKNMEKDGKLRCPVIAVNDSKMKYLFDSRYGTGESALFGILNATNVTLAGKTVVVAGYGWVGRGIAMRLRGMGANVIVTEVDPVKACEAVMEGFRVMKMVDAVKQADLVITATGNKKVVRREHFEVAKDRCVFCNAGHMDVEVWIPDLEEMAVEKKEVRVIGGVYGESGLVWRYKLKDGRVLYVLAKGRLVNLVAGQGHAADIMDLTFALQAESARYLVKNRGKLESKVYNVPEEVDRRVALTKLRAWGVEIDELTEEQRDYLSSWKV